MKISGETRIDISPLLKKQSVLSDELRHFTTSLKWCALDHSSCSGKWISYSSFTIFAFIVPLLCCFAIKVPDTSPVRDPISINKLVQIPVSGLAIISFFTLTRFFKQFSVPELLFLDVVQHDSSSVQKEYARELDKAFKYIACILFPSLLIETSHKIVFFFMVKVSFVPCFDKSVLLNYVVFFLVLFSWIYRTGVFLLVCVLFRSTCELQLLRFEGFKKFLEGSCGSDSGSIFTEHVRIRKLLSVTSHRYRFFIISCVVTLTVSQLGALLLVLASKSEKSFFNSGDLVVCSAVQLSGFILCIMGAAKITHRAQGIVSVATKWHMLITSSSCNNNNNNNNNRMSSSEDGYGSLATSINETAISDSFQTRQTLVTYLQHNNGGITLFGFALDRGLLHTLFAFEFSLVLWILSKLYQRFCVRNALTSGVEKFSSYFMLCPKKRGLICLSVGTTFTTEMKELGQSKSRLLETRTFGSGQSVSGEVNNATHFNNSL